MFGEKGETAKNMSYSTQRQEDNLHALCISSGVFFYWREVTELSLESLDEIGTSDTRTYEM